MKSGYYLTEYRWAYEIREFSEISFQTHLGQIIWVEWFPIGKTVVTIWVVVAWGGTNGLDGGTPLTACA